MWFPTRSELDAWSESGCPVYIRPLAPDHVEVGPRLGSMWASVFSPVLDLRFVDSEAGADVHLHRRLPHLTTGVLLLWTVVLIAWGAALFAGEAPGAAPFWALLALATPAAGWVGWDRGGRALDAGIPWLTEVLLAPDDEEDW